MSFGIDTINCKSKSFALLPGSTVVVLEGSCCRKAVESDLKNKEKRDVRVVCITILWWGIFCNKAVMACLKIKKTKLK